MFCCGDDAVLIDNVITISIYPDINMLKYDYALCDCKVK